MTIAPITPVEMEWVVTPQPEPQEPPGGKYLFRFLHDGEIPEITPRHGKPEVFWLNELGWEFTEKAQRLAYDLFLYGAPSLPNNLKKTRYTSVWDCRKAFANKTGYGALDPPRKNFITGANVTNKDAVNPEIDKVRICGGATVLGEIKKDVRWWNYFAEPKRWEIVDFVWVETIHPDYLPTIDELIQTPWLYFHATTSYAQRAGQFPNGQQPEFGIYEPTLVPLVSPYPVGWPLKYLQPVNAIADPYKFGG